MFKSIKIQTYFSCAVGVVSGLKSKLSVEVEWGKDSESAKALQCQLCLQELWSLPPDIEHISLDNSLFMLFHIHTYVVLVHSLHYFTRLLCLKFEITLIWCSSKVCLLY